MDALQGAVGPAWRRVRRRTPAAAPEGLAGEIPAPLGDRVRVVAGGAPVSEPEPGA
jgi:hypothetical protein